MIHKYAFSTYFQVSNCSICLGAAIFFCYANIWEHQIHTSVPSPAMIYPCTDSQNCFTSPFNQCPTTS